MSFLNGFKNIPGKLCVNRVHNNYALKMKCDVIFLAWQTNENDVLLSNDTRKLGKRNSKCSYQGSNLRPST